jgi:hypothetical protein
LSSAIGIFAQACGSNGTALQTKASRRPGSASIGGQAKRLDILQPQGSFISRHGIYSLPQTSRTPLRTNEITHGSFGFEYFPNNNWSVLAEAYYQNLDNLVVDLDRVSGTFANIGDGTSYGVDFVVSGTIREGIYATATYSYNDAVIDRKDGRGDVAADFSRDHVATLGLTWEITRPLEGRCPLQISFWQAIRRLYYSLGRVGSRTTSTFLERDH